MRDWKVKMAMQLGHGSWFLSLNDGMAAMPTIEKMLSPTATDLEGKDEILSERKPFEIQAATEDDHSISDSFDKLPQGSIATVKVSGTMFKYGTWCSYGTEEIADYMIEAAYHKNIGGMLFEGDSGGGGVNSVAPIRKAFNIFKSLGKPTFSLMDLSGSAMYYATSLSDKIAAVNDISASFGSIGIMFSYMDMSKYYENLGVKRVALYPAESSEKNLAFELAMKGEFDMIRTEELAPLARKFQSDVIADRGAKLKYQDDEKIIKGKMYGAKEAVDNGLIDMIATREQSIDLLLDMIKASEFTRNSKKQLII